MMTSKSDERIKELKAIQCFKAHKTAEAERLNRHQYNRQNPARLTRVLAVYGD